MEPRGDFFLLFLFAVFLLPGDIASQETDGGWVTSRHTALVEEESCTVERRETTLTYSQFIEQYAFSRPVILQGITDNSEFRAQCTKDNLLTKFGDHLVRLSTANTYSYRKEVSTPSVPDSRDHWRIQLWDCWLWVWSAFPLARPRLLRGDLRQEALVSVSPGENTGVPPQQDYSVLVAGHVPFPASMGEAHRVYHLPWRGPVLSRPLVARHPQPGHQCFHLHIPGVARTLQGIAAVCSAALANRHPYPLSQDA